MRQHVINLDHGSVGALQGGSIGQLDLEEGVTLILFGNETGRQLSAHAHRNRPNTHEQEHGNYPPANENGAPVHIAVVIFAKPQIEQVKELSDWAPAFLRGRKSNAESAGERVKALKAEINTEIGNGNCELLVEQTLDAAHGSHRDEHCGKNQGDSDHRAR